MSKGIKLSKGSGQAEFKDGTVYTARIARIISTGIRAPHPKFPDGHPQEQLRFSFEIPEVTVKGSNGEELPALIDLPFINNVGGGKKESLLEGIYNAAGIGLDQSFENLLGKAVSLKVEKDGDYFKIVRGSVSGLPGAVADTVPPLVAKSYFFDFDAPDEDILKGLPDFLKDHLSQAQNFSGSKVEEILGSSEEGSEEEEEVDTEGVL